MTLVGLALGWLFEPPKPPSPLERAASRAIEIGTTTIEAAELVCEVLPPTPEELADEMAS